MIVSGNIDDFIEFLKQCKEKGYTEINVIGKTRKQGWDIMEQNHGISILTSKGYPNVIGIDGEDEFAKFEEVKKNETNKNVE